MEKMEFLKGMKKLSIAYSKDIKEEELGVWYNIFKEKDLDLFYQAIDNIILENKYFPSIAELKEKYEDILKSKYIIKMEEMRNGGFLTENDYQKLLMWLSEGIIPHWFKKLADIKEIEMSN